MPLSQSLKKNSKVLWTISVIQDQNPQAQTKSEFSEMSKDVLNSPQIESLTICLADNLQRFRLMIDKGLSESDAVKECQKLSQQWHEDNPDEIEKLKQSKKLSFLTWQEFLDWPEREKTILQVEQLYKENKDFRRTCDGRIKQAHQSISPDAKISNPIEQTALLKKYLFEECAYQKFAASKGFYYEFYKMPASQPFRHIKKNNDFVPAGFMVEVYFTQFNGSPKKYVDSNSSMSLQDSKENICFDSYSFKPLFNKKDYERPEADNRSKPRMQMISEFIEKALQLVPSDQQDKAIESLLKFATTEIIPLCYQKADNQHVNNILTI